MKIIAVLPPLIECNICTPDEGERIMVNLPIEGRESFVDLGYK
jgi:hypothetical protein